MKKLFKIIRNVLFVAKYTEGFDQESWVNSATEQRFEKKHLRRLWPFIKPFAGQAIVAFLLLVVSSLLTLPRPLFLKYIIDNAILEKDSQLLGLLILIIAGLVIFGAVITLVQKYYFLSFERKILLSIQYQLFNRVLRFPKSFFDNKRTGYLMSRLLGDVYQLRTLFSSTLAKVITNTFIFLGTLVFLVYLHWKLTIVAVAILPFFIISVRAFSKKVRLLGHRVMEKSAQVSSSLQESLSGLGLIKSFATEYKESNKIYNFLKDSMDANVEQKTINSVSQFVIGLVSSVGSLIILWVGALEIISDRLSIGSFIAFTGYVSTLYGPAQFLAQINLHLQTSFAAFERVFALFDLVPEDNFDKDKLSVVDLHGKVEFLNVNFAYENNLVLKDISFSVNPGELVAIVGKSGAGKSTLVNLLISLYKPQSGNILFDNVNIEKINLCSLRKRIGIVSQEIFLFDDTIANNIRYSRMDSSDEDIVAASKMAMCHDFILDLADGYETMIGERGVRLSLGQKQRIAIARVLLKEPDILIFDEPSSALDAITEKAIKQMILSNQSFKTTFIIAHRLSTVKSADKIFVLVDGMIKNIGSHQVLFNSDNLYQEMCREQSILG